MVVLVVHHIAHEQNHGLLSVILPPVRGAAGLWPDVAGLVRDRRGAVARILDDLALGDVDDRRTIAVTMPRHNAAGLDRELAKSKLPILAVRRFLLKIDGGKHRVRNALAGVRDGRSYVGFQRNGTFAGRRDRYAAETRCSENRRSHQTTAKPRSSCDVINHCPDLLCISPGLKGPNVRSIVKRSLQRKCRVALVSIANRYRSEHALDVGRKGREDVDHRPHLRSRNCGFMGASDPHWIALRYRIDTEMVFLG